MTVDVREAFFDAYVTFHPEDASTLGAPEGAGRLSDPATHGAELASLKVTLAALGDDADVDAVAVRRFAGFRAKYIEEDRDAENLELATLPHAAIEHDVLHGKDARARAAAVPAFLLAHAENLRRGVKEGRAPDREVIAAHVETVLPGAARALDPVDPRASAAYASFARFVAQEIAPHARDVVRLGEREVALRLHDVMGATSSPSSLLALARAEITRAKAEIAARTAGEDPRAAVLSLIARRPASVEEIVDAYRAHLAAATRFVVDRKLVPVPESLALDLEPLPPAIADGTALTNWPAPLLDAKGRGHALYALDPTSHLSVAAKNLAVHEGIPGHYLQSATWQASASRARAARFVGVADPVALAHGYFGAMLAVEGWAVHMERLLCAHGFYDEGPERLFFAVCDAIRAARVVLDLELQAGDMSVTDAARVFSEATFLPEAAGRSQALRARRVPLQSLTYFTGAEEIARLRAQSPLPDLEFHRALLARGPVL